MKICTGLVTILFLVLGAGMAVGADIDVSQTAYATSNGAYDRNPSIVYDGGDYWLFYTKGDDVSTAGVRGTGYNPDADSYVVYYKTAGTVSGLTSAAETKLELSETSRPAGFSQRVASAAYFGGKMYCFVSSGQDGADRGLYYYVYDAGSWSGPVQLIADATARGGHVNVATDGLRIYIVWESSDGSSDCYTWNETTLSPKIDISGGNMPKITVLQSKLGVLFVVNIEDGTGDIEVFSAVSSPNPLFNPYSTAISGGGFYDPCIFNDGTDLYIVTAPWVATDRQYLVQTKFDVGSSTWSTPRYVSYGGYGTVEWWDFWPCGFFDGTAAYIFFTTEADNGPVFGDGEIASIKMDWDLSHDHYFFIQNALNQATAGDAVYVGPGDFEEQLEIDENLSLTGSGRDVTVVQSPASLSLSFSGTYTHYPIVFVHNAADVAISDLTIDGLGRGNANNRFVGLGYYNAGGAVDNVRLTGIRETPFSGAQHGVSLYAVTDDGGPYAMTVAGTDVDDMQKTGMVFTGAGLDAAITGCTITGAGQTDVTAQNGIQVSTGATCDITGCNVDGIWYTGPDWSASGLLLYFPGPDAVLSGNTVTGSQGALNAYFADNLVLDDNVFDANDFTFIWGGDGVAVTGNTFTDNIQALYIADATNLTTSGNGFDANEYAVIVDGLADGIGFSTNDILNSTAVGVTVVPYGTDEPVNVTLSGNNISGNAVGVDNTTTIMVDAEANWWGDASGPNLATKGEFLIEFDRPRVVSLSEGETKESPQKGYNAVRSDFTDASADKAGAGDAVSALVDYSPWWGDNYTLDPHASSWNWYVDPSNNSTIQEGVDAALAGDEIFVTAGTYEEQVDAAKDLTINGAGKEVTTIQSPISLTAYFTTAQNNYPIVYIHDADVDLNGVTVDGLNRGNGNYRFVGIGFWNSGGSVVDCAITGITDTPFTGSQHGNGIYAYNNTGGPYAIEVTDVDVDDFQKNGITLLGENLTAAVTGCTVTGIGPTAITAQNGIQLGYGSGGTITDCSIDGIAYDVDGGWVAGGILLYQATTVDISGATAITNSQANIIYQETDGTVDGATITTSGVYYEEGVSIRDYAYTKETIPTLSYAPISPMTEPYEELEAEKGAPTNVTITNTTLVGVNEPSSYGIAVWALGDDVNVHVEDCDVRQWEIGLVAYESGSAADLSVYHTGISGNDMGYWTNAVVMQNAEYNWWGDLSGPYHATGNTLGLGNEVSDYVDYEPWCNEDFTVCDYGQYPQVTLNAPFDGSVIPDPFTQLSATITDESPVEIRIFGDRQADPSHLLFVQEDAGGQGLAYDVLHDWTAQVFDPEATNTVGLWHFDENSGTEVLDESEYANVGTFTNFDHPAWTADGRFGYAVEFDGVNDYISIPDDPSLDVDPATGVLTIEAWLYPHASGDGQYRAFISKRDSSQAGLVNYALYLDQNTGALTLYTGIFPAGYYISNIIVPANEWSYIAVSLDATEGMLRFYRNGIHEDSISGVSFGPVHNGDLQIGTSKTPSGNRNYVGLIDEVRLTKRILTSAEIAASYALNGGTFYWKVTADDGAHTTVSDVWHFTANDTVLPTVEVLSPDPGLTWDEYPALEISFGDDAGIDQAFYQINDCAGSWTEFWSYNSGVLDTTIIWQTPELVNGAYSVYFKVIDDAGNVNENNCSYSWDYTISRTAPEITSTAPTIGYTGTTYTYDVEADGAPTPKYTLLTAVAGMEIDTLTGVIDWMPDEVGDFNVSVKAYNDVGDDIQNFVISVTDTLDPEVILVSPENAASIVGFTADLLTTVNDHSDMTVWIYGDKYPSASDLLYVIDGVTGTDIGFTWWTSVFEPDPPYTRGLWHFDENTGMTIGDESFQGNAGTAMGSPDWTSDGQFGYAMIFDGTGDFIAIEDDNSLDIDSTTGKLTLEAWVYPHATGQLRDRAIIAKRNHTSNLQNYSLWLSDVTNRLTFAGSDIVTGGWKESSISVPWEMWSYTAITVDASTGLAIFYLINENGTTVDTVSGAYLGEANADTLMIGGGGGLTHCFDGSIDEVRITGKVYGYNEIMANANLSGNYYWRVKARDAFGNETISPVQFFYVQTFVCGDANGDGATNVGDVVTIINYVFKGGPAPDPMRSADANGDGDVNVGDAVFLINFIFKGGPPPVC